jgi:hypothetical protein
MMAPRVDEELSECVGCDAVFPTYAALVAHVRTCAVHPFAADFARLPELAAAVDDLRHAVAAWVEAVTVLAEAVGRRATEMEHWRARWAAERELYALAGHTKDRDDAGAD